MTSTDTPSTPPGPIGGLAADTAGPPLTEEARRLEVQPRPTLGGRAFAATYLSSRALGRIHPRLARPSLMRLWFTPWVHPSALAPVELPAGLHPWSLATPGRLLRGYAGGEGATVVLVHGWSGRAADWRHLAADLVAAGRRVVVPDLPAHGATEGRRTDLFELSQALAAVLAHERPDALVAHSMGFPATMLTFEAGGEVPSRVVALAPGRRMAHALEAFAARSRLRGPLIDELRRGTEARFGPDIWDVLDVDRVLPDLGAEGLVLHDVDDDEVPLSDAQAISQRWSGARLVTTEGLGHRRIMRDPGVRRTIVTALS